MNTPVLLFDIGGTNMRFGLSSDGNTFESPRIVPTPQNYDEGIKTFIATATEMIAGVTLGGIVGGVAGSLAENKSIIYNSPHLPNWRGKPLVTDLTKQFNCQVIIDNDTAVVGLGEATTGAGKGYSTVVYVTVSTGVNGVKIEDGKIAKNFLGYEIGHHIIDLDAQTTNVEYGQGELEDFVSGAAIEKRAGIEPLKVEDKLVWEQTTKFLVVGLYNTVLYWSPEILVVGGPLITKINFEEMKQQLTQRLKIVFPDIPRIVPAVLGEFGGLHGALNLFNINQ